MIWQSWSWTSSILDTIHHPKSQNRWVLCTFILNWITNWITNWKPITFSLFNESQSAIMLIKSAGKIIDYFTINLNAGAGKTCSLNWRIQLQLHFLFNAKHKRKWNFLVDLLAIKNWLHWCSYVEYINGNKSVDIIANKQYLCALYVDIPKVPKSKCNKGLEGSKCILRLPITTHNKPQAKCRDGVLVGRRT